MKPSALLRLYPRAWRERYGDEFVALLHETGASPAQVMDIVRAAMVQRVLSLTGRRVESRVDGLRQGLATILLAVTSGTLIAVAANIAAFALQARYGHLPSFHSVITDGVPRIAYPPVILPTLFAFARLQFLVMLRAILSGGSFVRWLRVSRIEMALWALVMLVSSTASQLMMFATFGEPGFPWYSRSEILWDAWPQCLVGCLYLTMSTNAYWDSVLRSRERRMMRPGEFQGITRLGL